MLKIYVALNKEKGLFFDKQIILQLMGKYEVVEHYVNVMLYSILQDTFLAVLYSEYLMKFRGFLLITLGT